MSVIKLCCSSVKSGFKESAASLSIIRLACAGRNPVRFAGRPTLRFLGVLAANGLSWLNVLSSKRIFGAKYLVSWSILMRMYPNGFAFLTPYAFHAAILLV